MAYANAHVKVTILGKCYGGAEEWSTGFRMGSEDTGGGNSGVNAAWVDALLPLWQTFFQTLNVGISSTYTTTAIKASLITAAGNTDLSHIVTASYATPIAGGGTSSGLPPQVTLSAQLAAASPIGLGAKGRMYIPGINHQIQTNGKLTSTQCTNIANALRTFLDGAESATNSPGYVINASKGRTGTNPAAPVNRRVTSIRIGDVYDTQRRRRNQLVESYVSAALAA